MTIEDRIRDKKYNMILIEKLQKYQPYHQAKLIIMSEEILRFNQKQIIEQPKFTCCPLGNAFEKQTKTIEDQGKNQISAIIEHGKQIVESNQVAKNYFNIDRNEVSHEKQNEIFDRPVC